MSVIASLQRRDSRPGWPGDSGMNDCMFYCQCKIKWYGLTFWRLPIKIVVSYCWWGNVAVFPGIRNISKNRRFSGKFSAVLRLCFINIIYEHKSASNFIVVSSWGSVPIHPVKQLPLELSFVMILIESNYQSELGLYFKIPKAHLVTSENIVKPAWSILMPTPYRRISLYFYSKWTTYWGRNSLHVLFFSFFFFLQLDNNHNHLLWTLFNVKRKL